MSPQDVRSSGVRVAFVLLLVVLCVRVVGTQTRFAYSKGQQVSPSYEGWSPNADGSFTLFFGYMNTNWLEEFDIPIGPDNRIEPGGPDQGQPTHFYPRRNPFLFTIRVPKDFGSKELVWTLTANGKTEHAYASLKGDYRVDPQVIQMEVGGNLGTPTDELRTNVAPEVELTGDNRRTVAVGGAVTLVASAKDVDNIPARREQRTAPDSTRHGSATAAAQSERFTIPKPPPNQGFPASPPGLRLSWMVYRGKAAAVTFSPEQMKTWQDTRVFSNSPWSPGSVIPPPPPDGKWVVRATFQEPGTYVLRAVVSDSALFTYEDVTVTVTR